MRVCEAAQNGRDKAGVPGDGSSLKLRQAMAMFLVLHGDMPKPGEGNCGRFPSPHFIGDTMQNTAHRTCGKCSKFEPLYKSGGLEWGQCGVVPCKVVAHDLAQGFCEHFEGVKDEE